MKNGRCDAILDVNLSTGAIETTNPGDDFLRMYCGGSGIGAYYLLKDTLPDTDPLSINNIIIIAPGITTGAAISGVSRCCMTSLSPLTGMAADSQAGGSIGPMIKRSGYDAIVIRGRADRASYILVDGMKTSILDAAECAGKTVSAARAALLEKHGAKNVSIIQCGPAGEKLVRYANVMADGNDAFGRGGMGAVFGSKNLRAVVVIGSGELTFADPDGLRELARAGAKRIPSSGFPETLKKYGTPGVVKFQAEAGNFATHNYSRGWHPEYMKLDGSVFESEIGAGAATCFGCAVSCRKKVKTDDGYNLSDALGGPEFETLGMLGANLDITDASAVAKANELCNEYGIDTITMGCVAGYLFECAEQGMMAPADTGGTKLSFGDPKSLFNLIEAVARRDGFGDTCADGFESMIRKYGEKTRPFAINVKGAGLAVHLPQYKPSQALMYAVCPIGPDHMSSEHDWLLASASEASRGLGILGQEDNPSTTPNKVRMTAYSQIYYSLLDALSLCMFCWGPGNLFTYRDLEDLVRFATGWDMTFWELMKAGERRITMLRHVNAKRGFDKSQDLLPDRLFEKLPDGPSKGRHVDRDDFARMKDQYYAFMGWDAQTGNPTEGKLMELGLEWAI
ncbi:MAG: aldehyde ferredoxin oxidoreductase family protein [Spirochaetes bacterium]|nr:aldehyde ferredoxin oxidoreductase family protein [Spirochaetota bacterium]